MILEIQATMPSPPATLKPYMNGVYIAYGIVSWCYCEGTPSFFAYGTMLPACPALFVSLPAPCLPGQAQAQLCAVCLLQSVLPLLDTGPTGSTLRTMFCLPLSTPLA